VSPTFGVQIIFRGEFRPHFFIESVYPSQVR